LQHFSFTYPQYKFIPEKEAKAICKKYGLVMGDSSLYKGDIPLKNLKEMETFFNNNPIKDEDKAGKRVFFL
jgi:hypothetical protein